MNYVVMGIDRIGKDTFISYNFPNHKKIHLTKPPKDVDPLMFSKAEYCDYFMNLKKSDNIVYNRGHIDEFVYAPIYRKYSTYWLTIMEQEFTQDVANTVFILLYTDNFDMMVDDGLSHDFNRKEEEQELFHKYFDQSYMINKIKIKVNDGNKYRNPEDIRNDLGEALRKVPIISGDKEIPVEVLKSIFNPE